MNYSPCVHIIEGQTNLDKPVEYFHLCEELVVLDLPLDMVGQVSYFAVLHNDDQLLQCEIALLVSHDVLVVKIL